MTVTPHALPATGRPLAGLRVVEVATFVAGPLGGMTLAQLGADVIRVDPPRGAADYTRWPVTASGMSLYWAGLNKAKRSLCIDFRSAEGRDLVTRLIAGSGPGGRHRADQHRPAVAELSGPLRGQARPDLPADPRTPRRRSGRGTTRSTPLWGFPLVTGPEGHAGPVNHVLSAWDIACGLYAAIGLLGAERHRRLTGKGQQLSVALADVALATAGNLGFLAEAEVNRVSRPRIGNHLLRLIRLRLRHARWPPGHGRGTHRTALGRSPGGHRPARAGRRA